MSREVVVGARVQSSLAMQQAPKPGCLSIPTTTSDPQAGRSSDRPRPTGTQSLFPWEILGYASVTDSAFVRPRPTGEHAMERRIRSKLQTTRRA